jgi:probable rRNA maturation factor
MEINVIIDGEFLGCPDVGWFQDIVARVLQAQDIGGDVEIGLLITGQEKIQELNKTYRGRDRPTDVLAFYMTGAGEFVQPPDDVKHLGEVVISYPQAVLQAREQGNSAEKELRILIIHGILHLLGYDHEETKEKRGMSAREQVILRKIILEQENEQ